MLVLKFLSTFSALVHDRDRMFGAIKYNTILIYIDATNVFLSSFC